MKEYTFYEEDRCIGRIVHIGPPNACCRCETIMPRYLVEPTRVECHKCTEKRLKKFGIKLKRNFKLLR